MTPEEFNEATEAYKAYLVGYSKRVLEEIIKEFIRTQVIETILREHYPCAAKNDSSKIPPLRGRKIMRSRR